MRGREEIITDRTVGRNKEERKGRTKRMWKEQNSKSERLVKERKDCRKETGKEGMSEEKVKKGTR